MCKQGLPLCLPVTHIQYILGGLEDSDLSEYLLLKSIKETTLCIIASESNFSKTQQ